MVVYTCNIKDCDVDHRPIDGCEFHDNGKKCIKRLRSQFCKHKAKDIKNSLIVVEYRCNIEDCDIFPRCVFDEKNGDYIRFVRCYACKHRVKDIKNSLIKVCD